ncbi:hypothetical protein ID858_15890 [Xenorhabdus sp. DI]|uniref:hypothetical protein n=1 Tax=Xenorhabdus doucetiae TaxID=351671 RepID=UPI0019AD1309|nr:MULTISPECIES: hypothetical protein [unclassified Xenorhabdus]MBD2783790.1 hypothetical protein [Xenorhabdus sp. 3]MBD2789977.1 hypothetical protein [Xenorhabdus sp. DI]
MKNIPLIMWLYATIVVFVQYQDIKQLTDKNEKLEKQLLITHNAFQSIRVFNDISQLNSKNRHQAAVDSEQTQAAIKQVVISHDCANRVVPDGAVIRLQQHANRIRTGAAAPDPGTLAR